MEYSNSNYVLFPVIQHDDSLDRFTESSHWIHIGFTMDSPWIHQRLVKFWSPQPTLHVGMDMRITLIAFAIGRIGVSEFRRIFCSFSKTP